MGFPSQRLEHYGHKAMAYVAFRWDLRPSPKSVRLSQRTVA